MDGSAECLERRDQQVEPIYPVTPRVMYAMCTQAFTKKCCLRVGDVRNLFRSTTDLKDKKTTRGGYAYCERRQHAEARFKTINGSVADAAESAGFALVRFRTKRSGWKLNSRYGAWPRWSFFQAAIEKATSCKREWQLRWSVVLLLRSPNKTSSKHLPILVTVKKTWEL